MLSSAPVSASFATASEMRQAAHDHGFRIDLKPVGYWLAFASTTAPGRIYVASLGDAGNYLLATDHAGVWLELAADGAEAVDAGPVAGFGAIQVRDGTSLHEAVSRIYRLACALPTAPLETFRKKTAKLPRTTEAERLVVRRIGQETFRDALMKYWNDRCPLTGIDDRALLRASHIVPWARCQSDAERLDVHNGLLLAVHWDAAFDARLVSFDDDGAVLVADGLSAAARRALATNRVSRLAGLTPGHRKRLEWHRGAGGAPGWKRAGVG